jgi:hypothetical protein
MALKVRFAPEAVGQEGPHMRVFLIGFARVLQNMSSQSRTDRQIWDELNGSVVKTAHLVCADWSQTGLRTWTFSSYHAFDHCSISLLREAARCLAHFIPLCS